VNGFETAGAQPIDLSIARSELAAVRLRAGDRAEARTLLVAALPALRAAMLPQEISRAAAERSAGLLGLSG